MTRFPDSNLFSGQEDGSYKREEAVNRKDIMEKLTKSRNCWICNDGLTSLKFQTWRQGCVMGNKKYIS